MKSYIRAKHIVMEDTIIHKGVVEIEKGIITNIYSSVGNHVPVIDYSDAILAPGYVDTHIHGAGGHDIMDADPEGLYKISETIVQNGVTTFFPTTLTDTVEKTDRAIQNIADNYHYVKGAKVGGIFLEGPFFTPKYKGAQNPDYFLHPDIELLRHWKKLAKKLPLKIAVAPESEGAQSFIRKANRLGVKVALGHSNATYDQVKEAVHHGASIFVHVYNAMSSLHHRNPGMVGAALTLKDVFAELICDGHHVHPAAAQVVIGMRTPQSVALVTDCMSAGNMPEGSYKLGEFDVKVKDGAVRMKDGNLAGSILTLKDAVKNVVKWGLATPFEAIQMASLVPAKSMGIDDVTGKIAIGRVADLVVLDQDLEVLSTFINGKRVYLNECQLKLLRRDSNSI